MRIGENLAELLDGPFGCRMGGHVEVQNSPRTDLHRHEQIKDLELRGDRRAEIASHDVLGLSSGYAGALLLQEVENATRTI